MLFNCCSSVQKRDFGFHNEEFRTHVVVPNGKSKISFLINTTTLFLLRARQADAEKPFHALAQIKWNEGINVALSGNGFVKYDAGDGQQRAGDKAVDIKPGGEA